MGRLAAGRLAVGGLAVAGLAVAAALGLTACGSAATSKAASTTSPAQIEAKACSSALGPWTTYIADTDDFKGWVDTVGPNSPVVLLPQTAAKVYLRLESKAGVNQASSQGFDELDRACDTFAKTHPSFDFAALPPAPSVPT